MGSRRVRSQLQLAADRTGRTGDRRPAPHGQGGELAVLGRGFTTRAAGRPTPSSSVDRRPVRATFSIFEDLTTAGTPGWSPTGTVDALSCQATPGRVPTTISVERSALTSGWLSISWSPSCSVGGEDYGIYEGTIGGYYTHLLRDCSDDGNDFVEELSPAVGSSYYLVVAHNGTLGGPRAGPGSCYLPKYLLRSSVVRASGSWRIRSSSLAMVRNSPSRARSVTYDVRSKAGRLTKGILDV